VICALHLCPHPDDEVIGAGGTLLGLAEHGHRVVNFACGLGRPDQRERRRAELQAACERAGFELVVREPPLAISRTDDLELAQRTLAADVVRLVREEAVDLVVSPSPHDGHHGHEVVGRAARDALARLDGRAPRWWMWGLWSDLPLPTLLSAFDEARLERVLHVLAAHAGELARNDYPGLVRARARANAILGAERVFGFGAAGGPEPFAELLTEAVRSPAGWLAGARRRLDLAAPLEGDPGAPLGWWLDAVSLRDRALQEGWSPAVPAPTAAARPRSPRRPGAGSASEA
jgi:LmbE family N-acetylglucosaminyl deacetylase